MLKLSEAQVQEIASDLEAGLQVYVHKTTGKIKTDAKMGNWFEASDEYSDEILDDLSDDYYEIERMGSRESFIMMEEFISHIPDKEYRNRLYVAIDKPKPFKNFKQQIDYSEEYRQKWFDYRAAKYIAFVKRQLETVDEDFYD